MENPVLHLKEVSVYQKNNLILSNVNLTVGKGELVYLIGKTGSGKSSLIKLLYGDLPLTKGQGKVVGFNLKNLTEDEIPLLRRKLGVVFQDFKLLTDRSVYDNLAFVLKATGWTDKAKIDKRIEEVLAKVKMQNAGFKFPHELSGGEQQRVAIARALASDPKVLLCDEATSALDPATTQSILKLLKEINRTLGITILLITHEMEVVKQICDQVAVIDQGRLVEQGTVGEIFANPKTELAQEFIRSTFHISLPDEYLENLTDTPKHSKAYPIIKFEFTGRSVDAPLLSQASKKFGVELSILTSQIDYAGGVKFGYTIAEVEGDEDAITQTKVYLMENNVRVEVLGYVQ